jgi:uncharacterized protein
MEIIPEFEYDASKSRTNVDKHGIDFEAARALWLDGRAIESTVEGLPEARFLRIGVIDGVFWTAICTLREARVRLISVRRARMKERLAYEAQNDQH